MQQLLGGKGASLAEMTRIGLPVPQGFGSTVCLEYLKRGDQTIWMNWEEIMQAMRGFRRFREKFAIRIPY